jgi:hypothetical protein
MDTQRCLIGECVRVFLQVEMKNYCKLKEAEEWLKIDFVISFYEKHDTNNLMDSWWIEDKNFTNQTSDRYSTTNLRETYIYLMALLCQFHGEKDWSRFSEAWMRLSYTITIFEIGFNWVSIIFK